MKSKIFAGIIWGAIYVAIVVIISSLAGCATATHNSTGVSTVSTAQHIARAGQYVDTAARATGEAQRRVTDIQTAAGNARKNAATLADAKTSESEKTAAAQAVVEETQQIETAAQAVQTKLDEAAGQLSAEKTERQAAQTNLAEVQAQADALAAHDAAETIRANSATKERDTARTEAHENAKERDVVLIAFAVIFALWSISETGTLASKVSPTYSWAIQAAVFAGALVGGYVAGRFALHSLAKFIP